MNDAELDQVLFKLSPSDSFTIRQAFEGILVTGGTGAGKTSGPGETAAKAVLEKGWGGLVLCAKVDEADLWIHRCKQAGREHDVTIVSEDGENRINVFDYCYRLFGNTPQIVRVVLDSVENGTGRRQGRDPYWEHATSQYLTNAIDLVTLATDQLDLADVVGVLRSAPLSAEVASAYGAHARGEASPHSNWAVQSKCARMLRIAESRSLSPGRQADLAETAIFFLEEFPNSDPRTRANVLSSLMSELTSLMRSPFRELFGTDTTIRPEDSFDGKIYLLNFPIKKYGEAGRFAQTIFKGLWQRAVERRGAHGIPVFLWVDEAQCFATSYDSLFFQTARDARVVNMLLTQSIANLRAALGDDDNSKDVSDTFLGNLQTMVFLANSCPVNNEYAERVFGREVRGMLNYGVGPDGDLQVGLQKGLHPVLPSNKFTTLKKGGAANDRIVEGYVFQAGRSWQANPGKNWLLAEFRQA